MVHGWPSVRLPVCATTPRTRRAASGRALAPPMRQAGRRDDRPAVSCVGVTRSPSLQPRGRPARAAVRILPPPSSDWRAAGAELRCRLRSPLVNVVQATEDGPGSNRTSRRPESPDRRPGVCLLLLVALLRAVVRDRTELVAENLLLRHQLAVLARPT